MARDLRLELGAYGLAGERLLEQRGKQAHVENAYCDKYQTHDDEREPATTGNNANDDEGDARDRARGAARG